MRQKLSICFVVFIFPLFSGCVATLIPLAAAGALGKLQIDASKARKEIISAGAVSIKAEALPTSGSLSADGPAAGDSLSSATTAPVTDALPASGPSASSYSNFPLPPKQRGQSKRFSGGKEIALSTQQLDASAQGYLARVYKSMRPGNSMPYAGFTDYALAQAGKLGQKQRLDGAVLVQSVDIIKPKKISCAGKPLGVIIDLDTPDMAAWVRSETLFRQDGLAEALVQLRTAGITIIWVSNLSARNAPEITSILKDAGLASATESDDFLFLDRGGDDRKQSRRWDAARSYCIAAIAGDKRSDFDELYDYLRDPDSAVTLEHMFGSGWFIFRQRGRTQQAIIRQIFSFKVKDRHGLDQRRNSRTCGTRIARRILCQFRHRHSNLGGEPYSRWHRSNAAKREWHAGHWAFSL